MDTIKTKEKQEKNEWYKRLFDITQKYDFHFVKNRENKEKLQELKTVLNDLSSTYSKETILADEDFSIMYRHLNKEISDIERYIFEKDMVTKAVLQAEDELLLDYNNRTTLEKLMKEYPLNMSLDSLAMLILNKSERFSLKFKISMIMSDHEFAMKKDQDKPTENFHPVLGSLDDWFI